MNNWNLFLDVIGPEPNTDGILDYILIGVGVALVAAVVIVLIVRNRRKGGKK